MDTSSPPPPRKVHLLIIAAVVAVTAMVLLAMGRAPISESGRIWLWSPNVASAENSQHIADWYSFSHVIHGIVFYALFRLAGRGRWSVGACLVAAVAVEGAWEIFENTPFTIERYRTATIALDYYGDSVLNSVCDILWCITGFLLAWRLPPWASAGLVAAMEVGVLVAIRDNLSLNILMLVWPIDAIRQWQHGG